MLAKYTNHDFLQDRIQLALKQISTRGLLLLHGPSGCGKTHLCAWLHQHSHFSEQPLEVQEAAGLVENRFESQLFGHVKGAFTGAVADFPGLLGMARQGVLVIESLEDLALEGQARLLRFLETRAYRPVGATGERAFSGALIFTSRFSPQELRRQGQLREDVYYRLAGAEIALPAFSQRPLDFDQAFAELAEAVGGSLGKSTPIFNQEDREACRLRPLPGGLHTLRNLLLRAAIMQVPIAALKESAEEGRQQILPNTGALKTDLEMVEKALLARALEQHPHSRKLLAKHLGVSMRTLMYKLKRHGLGGESR